MPWCQKCGNGSPTYKYTKCGHCQSTDIGAVPSWEKRNGNKKKNKVHVKYEPVQPSEIALDPKVEKAIKLEEAVVTEEKKY